MAWDGRNALRRIDKAHIPKRVRIRRQAVGIEGIGAVILRLDVNHVMRSLSRDGDIRNVQRLGEYAGVHRKLENFAKLSGIHVLGSENGFIQIAVLPAELTNIL